MFLFPQTLVLSGQEVRARSLEAKSPVLAYSLKLFNVSPAPTIGGFGGVKLSLLKSVLRLFKKLAKYNLLLPVKSSEI